MENLILDNISLILLLPLWIFLIIMCGRFFSVYVNRRIIYFLTLLASMLGMGMCGLALLNLQEPIEWIYPFIQINDFKLSIGLLIDKLSLIVAAVLFIVSFAVQLFSISYMRNEKKNYRFFALLNLFNFGMAFLLFSPNLFQFYVFWEIIGIVSYLLIGFEYKNNTKSQASKRVFIINRVGDTALMTGIILVSYYMYEYVGNKAFVTLSFQDLNSISTLLMAYTTTPVFHLICGLFIFAAAVKSAQFPFYTWLQDAMEAKVPVSALLHSATMVAAGVYLLIRMMPFFTLSGVLTKFILILGLLTAIICSFLASVEINYKKILAYSTSANIGLMFVMLGLVNIKCTLIFLIAHAFIKSMLFVLLPKEQILSKVNSVLLIIGGLSLAGILFAGLSSKELIYKSLSGYNNLPLIFLFISFISAFYTTRLVCLIYKNSEIKNPQSIIELTSFLILLSANAGLYLILKGTYHIREPFAAAIGGLCLALLLSKNNALEKLHKTPKLLEKLYNNWFPHIYEQLSDILNVTDKKVFSNYKVILFISKLPVSITNWIETNVMNKSVKLVSDYSKWLSQTDMVLQSGNIQTYNAYAFIIIAIITAFAIIGYKIILG